MSPIRLLHAVVLAALVVVLGYRILAVAGSEGRALASEPVARLELSPLAGAAFGELAVASQSADDASVTRTLQEIATRRDPRNLQVRAWLADVHLRAGDYPAALEQLDIVLRLSPEARKALPRQMVQWAGDPAFAAALVGELATRPSWSRDMDKALRSNIQQPGAGAVFAGLSAAGLMNDEAGGRWIDSLMRAGDWGLAYSYWVSGLDLAPGKPLPMLYNGGFEQRPTQRGFDWRTERRSGTTTEFGPVEGANGNAAHLIFHGRPVAYANLELPLALHPGSYRLTMRVKAMALRTDQGLRWSMTCHGRSGPLVTGERLEGSFDWRTEVLTFQIPAERCPGQWLRIENPAPKGTARIVSGELWVEDMRLRPTGPAAGTAL